MSYLQPELVPHSNNNNGRKTKQPVSDDKSSKTAKLQCHSFKMANVVASKPIGPKSKLHFFSLADCWCWGFLYILKLWADRENGLVQLYLILLFIFEKSLKLFQKNSIFDGFFCTSWWKEDYWQNPENFFFRGGHFWRAKSKKCKRKFQTILLSQIVR